MATNFDGYIQEMDYEESVAKDGTQPLGARTRLEDAC